MNNEIADRYIAGESAGSLAREYKYATPSVLKFLRKRNIPIRSSKEVIRALSPEDECVLARQYLDGLSLNKLHKEWNIAISTVAKILKRHGIKTRSLHESVDFAEVNLPTSGDIFFYYLG